MGLKIGRQPHKSGGFAALYITTNCLGHHLQLCLLYLITCEITALEFLSMSDRGRQQCLDTVEAQEVRRTTVNTPQPGQTTTTKIDRL